MKRERLVSATEARDILRELLDEVPERDVVILRHSRPAALLVHPDRLERLIRRIEVLEDELAVREAAESPGDTISHEEMRRSLALDDQGRAEATG